MWLPYNDRYDVSDEGLVRRRSTRRILKPSFNGGYLQVVLCDNTNRKTIKVHQMVAQRFLPKIDTGILDIDHIDHNRANANASNLRWLPKRLNRLNTVIPASNINIRPNRPSPYRVEFTIHDKRAYNKSFKTLEEAIIARDAFKLTDAFKV